MVRDSTVVDIKRQRHCYSFKTLDKQKFNFFEPILLFLRVEGKEETQT
jgi:hypothetical protein